MTSTSLRFEIWLADLSRLEAALEAAERRLGLLSASERAWPADGTPISSTRRSSRIALRLALSRWGIEAARGVEFVLEPLGKPRLPGEPAHFSLSHTRHHALIAIAEGGPIGADLEGERVIQLSHARQWLMIAAADAMAGATAKQGGMGLETTRSIQAWTALEAFAKARGSGIGALLTDLGITASGARAPSLCDTETRAKELLAAEGLMVRSLSLPAGWYGSIAVPEDLAARTPGVREMTPEHCLAP